MRRFRGVTATLVAGLVFIGGATEAMAAKKTVTISGKAFIFNFMDTGISGAEIKVREFPQITARTDALGDYRMSVPNNASVTPYIVSGEGELVRRSKEGEPFGTMSARWNEIDLQTFHTRGRDLENVNFQTPRDEEYNALRAILNVPARADGRPEQCVIVTTSSARNVRGVDFRTYWDNTPHGVEGATSFTRPALPGPIYFNEHVIPDPAQTASSNDGGIIWPVVPTGTYRVITEHPTARFASFLATCEPGRIVNANPPWGAYELAGNERPLGASNLAARLRGMGVVFSGLTPDLPWNRNLLWVRGGFVSFDAAERITVRFRLRSRGRTVFDRRVRNVRPGGRSLHANIRRSVPPGPGLLQVRLTDVTGASSTAARRVWLPRVLKVQRPWGRR